MTKRFNTLMSFSLVAFIFTGCCPTLVQLPERAHMSELLQKRGQLNMGPEFYQVSTPIRSGSNKIKVGAWNIQKLSKRKSDAAFEKMAEVASHYDIIGIEEVIDTESIKRITQEAKTNHKTNFRRITTARKGRTKGESERYAFLYKPSRIIELNRGRFGRVRGMARKPYYAYFQAAQGGADSFDFILMLVHTKPGEGAILRRELDLLGQTYRATRDANPSEGDLLLAGDFNAGPKYVHFRTHLTLGSKLTSTIPDGTSTMVIGSRTNDNIAFGPPTAEDHTGESGVDNFTVGMDPGQARKVSDHKPVWSSFYVDRDTD